MPIFTNHPDQKNCVKKCASGRGRPLSISSTLPRRAYQGGISRRGSVGFGRPAAVHVRTPLAAGALNKAASAAAAERQRDAKHRSSVAADRSGAKVAMPPERGLRRRRWGLKDAPLSGAGPTEPQAETPNRAKEKPGPCRAKKPQARQRSAGPRPETICPDRVALRRSKRQFPDGAPAEAQAPEGRCPVRPGMTAKRAVHSRWTTL